ncbi:MAG TPA: multicopper oxidase domain-containing protein [Kineosporiaceae bacterium]|nr:multicopper oxidase domain-containing protein [Kineosporiaceae bacterium]
MSTTEDAPARRPVAAAAGACLLAAVAAVLALTQGIRPAEAAPGAAAAGASSAHGGHDMSGPGYWNAVAGSPAVSSSGAASGATGQVRTYYVRAEEVVWDYAPTGRNGITGARFDQVANRYVASGPGRIGSRYLKCLYRGYTDASFARRTPQPADLGLLGPVIRAEVGDTIRVVFRNSCRIPVSVHPHGVFYDKGSEGAPYADGTSGAGAKGDDRVARGGSRTYTWGVPERAGPGPHDGSSVMWMYHSHTDEVSDTYAGLVGPMVVTARGMARADGTPADVDHEVFSLFSVMNENASPYLLDSLHRFAKKPYPSGDDEGFEESNLMHSVNGYVFGNQPLVTLRRGEHVRWYTFDMGTEVDLHTPHWHGNDVVSAGMRMDVVNLLPGGMTIADMVPDNPGTWLFHCHVNDHITAGMLTRYRVL